MPFAKGNKLGQANTKTRVIEEAIRRAVAADDGKRIRAGVEKLLDQFGQGELAAINAVADRLDGRPNQQVEMNITKEARDYSLDELLERVAEVRGRIAAGADSAQASASEPSAIH